MTTDKITITINNSNGLRGRAWDASYPTWEQAADAIRSAMGWETMHVGKPVDRVRACYDGAEHEESDGDARWAEAPKVVITIESVT